ncbi:uncharacterized protein LOC124436825 isoform X2 [Xenia sp. Carnegie-2017]|uniref:uncharacterized protein LOC124436825 isoform X2 n=1 Tax=Xenia sp. Carnegie-2017 TaxID=2897299 RepID=UPI001F037EDC|nr:uncharacterized protein LOC124436825 isoform X2 [Xenia sp. Carnegie-2017]
MGSTLKETFSVEEVVNWLDLNGFQDISQTFCDEGIDGDAMSCLTEDALKSLVVRIGPRMKLLKAIKQMNTRCSTSTSESASDLSTCDMLAKWQDSNSQGNASNPGGQSGVCESLSSASSDNSVAKGRKQWTSPFVLPDYFPPLVEEALAKKLRMPKQVRCKFIQTIYDKICLFTVSPTPDQRRDVCRAIIAKYPFLSDASGGYEIWYRYLGEKVNNELRSERADPVVLSRKRKNVDGSPAATIFRAAVRRGIVNWAPPPIDGEDNVCSQAHVSWMKKELKRKQPNLTLVNKKMELTYSFRRRMINEEKHLLKDIMEQYPFLFKKAHLKSEYSRLMADSSAADCIQGNLLEVSPNIIRVAEQRKFVSEEANKLLLLCKPTNDSSCNDDEENENILSAENKTFVAMCLLPHLLER